MHGRGALGFQQSLVDRRDHSQPMDLVMAHVEQGHLGKGAHLRGVALDALFHGLPRRSLLVAGFAASQHQGCGHALQVPLEGAADGLVKVVDVEDQPAVRGRKSAQVAHMGVTAKLTDDARRGQYGQVGGHHRHRAAKVAEGRRGHQFVLELDERGDAALH